MKYESKKIASYKNEDIFSVSLINDNNFKINFYNFGGHIHQINIPYHNNIDKNEDVVLGYGNFNDCLTEKDYFNFIIGRVCNRISNSQFIINDKVHKLYANTPPHHLHGGKEGFNKKIWKINNINENKNEIICELEYFSPHLEENYPGNLQCKAIYSFNNNSSYIFGSIFKYLEHNIISYIYKFNFCFIHFKIHWVDPFVNRRYFANISIWV